MPTPFQEMNSFLVKLKEAFDEMEISLTKEPLNSLKPAWTTL